MKRFSVLLSFALLLLLCGTGAAAQPFIEDIRAFKKQDSASFPPARANLFIGSSSFTMWSNMREDFPCHRIINRGFGGSTLPDLIRYVNDIVFPYRPRQVIIYCGENDFAASDTTSVQTVVERFKTLFGLIRAQNKKMPIVYISMKPSPSRIHLMPKMEEANREIKGFLESRKKTRYIDVYSLMLTADGKPRPDLFLEDDLHMNEKGYAIWQKAIEPALKK